MKKVLVIFAAILFITACNQGSENGSESSSENNSQQKESVTVEGVLSSPEKYADKEVVIEGMVTHVCKHGGQKLFIVGEDREQQLRVSVSDRIPEFDMALEGSTVEFQGVVRLMEEEVAAAMQRENEEKDHHTGEEAHAKAENASYYIEALSFTEKPSAGI